MNMVVVRLCVVVASTGRSGRNGEDLVRSAPHFLTDTGTPILTPRCRYFPTALRLDQHGKWLMMSPSMDRRGTIGFRCVVDAAA
jgi:hypothetical protein